MANFRGAGMLRLFVIFVLSAASAAAIPIVFERNPEAFRALLGFGGGGSDLASESVPLVRTVAVEPRAAAPLGRNMRIEADQRGHFVAEFRLNGRPVRGMVDTGATLVAINQSTARRIGLPLKVSDFVHVVSTANGTAKAALVQIDELRIGKVAVENLPAMVLEDAALGETLIGMNFLKGLSKFSVEDGALLLTQ